MLSEAFTDALDQAYAQARTVLDPTAHERLEKALKLVATEQVRAIPFQEGNWFVQGSEPEPYLVVREPRWECECPDHHYRKVMCAHIIAAQLWVRAAQVAAKAPAPVVLPAGGEPFPDTSPEPAPVDLPGNMEPWADNDPEPEAPVATPVAPAALPEALFSLTLHGRIDGQDAMLTVRGMTAAGFLENLQAMRDNAEAMRGLLDPVPAPSPARPPETAAGAAPREGWCAVHNVAMRWNEGKGGRKGWHSHRLADGSWCKGTVRQ